MLPSRGLLVAVIALLGSGCDTRADIPPKPEVVAQPSAAELPKLEPWSDAWLVSQAPLYLDDDEFRRSALEASLTSHDNIYSRTRLSSYGHRNRGWDTLPAWIPRQRVVDGELVASLGRGEPLDVSDAQPIWDGQRPTDFEGWAELGRKVFYRYPLRPEIFAEYALAHPEVAADVGLRQAEDGSWPGVVAFADVDGSAQIGITCAFCHVAFDGTKTIEGQARRDLDYGRMRLTFHERTGAPLDPELARRMAAWGPGRADITQDDDEDPVAIVDLWNVRHNRFLTQAATLTHEHPAALAIRQETQILHANLERTRPPRELAWALAMFVYDIKPPVTAAVSLSAKQERGRGHFEQQCQRCHGDANYGGRPIAAATIGTNQNLAFGEARGTGLYRPSPLVRVREAAPYLHDGTLESLEALLGEERFEPSYANVRGVGAVQGHRYGMGLDPDARAELIDYLTTL